MTAATYGTYEYWHPLRQSKKIVPAGVGAALGPIAVVSDEFPDGVIEKNDRGFVKLVAAENFRAQCLNSGVPELVNTGNTLPQFWAFDPALDLARLAYTDEQAFDVTTNCSYADMFVPAYRYWTQCTDNTPDPSHNRGWQTGAVIPDTGALRSDCTLNDLPALFKKAWDRDNLHRK